MLKRSELPGGPQPGLSGDQNWRVNFHRTHAAEVFRKWLYKKTVCCSCLLSRKRSLNEVVWFKLT